MKTFLSTHEIILPTQEGRTVFISSSYRAMFYLLYGQKSEQANSEHINPAGKHTRFSRVPYFFISSLVKNMEDTSVLKGGTFVVRNMKK